MIALQQTSASLLEVLVAPAHIQTIEAWSDMTHVTLQGQDDPLRVTESPTDVAILLAAWERRHTYITDETRAGAQIIGFRMKTPGGALSPIYAFVGLESVH